MGFVSDMKAASQSSKQWKRFKKDYESALSGSEKKQYEEFKQGKLIRKYTCTDCGKTWYVSYKRLWGKLGWKWIWFIPPFLFIPPGLGAIIVGIQTSKDNRLFWQDHKCPKCLAEVKYEYIPKGTK